MGTRGPASSATAERAVDAGRHQALHDIACVIHLHSTYSDGSASVDEILDAARAAGADAVLLTDHDTLGARDDGRDGWHDGVLLVVGVEVSPRGGHFLAFDVAEAPSKRGGEAAIPAEVARLGGFGFAAHPCSGGSRIAERLRLTGRIGKPHGWPAELLEELDGIELWSLTTDAGEAWRSPLEAIGYMRDPERYLDGPPPACLAAWDELCKRRRVAAIGGLDAHQHGIRIGRRVLTPMPNRRYFALLRTYALTAEAPGGDADADSTALLSALREGRCYLGVDAIAPARGFRFWAESANEVALMGEEHPAGDWELRARLPRGAEVSLLRDGAVIQREEAATLAHRTPGRGVYRLEARLEHRGRLRPWIYSNPIYLR